MKKQLGILVDLRRCIGCETCTLACRMEKKTPIGTRLTRVYFVGKNGMSDVYNGEPYGTFPKLKSYTMPVFCNHCQDPACKENLPKGVIEKKGNGIVVIDKNKAHTKDMVSACPYERIFWDEKEKKIIKCDLCLDRVEDDKAPLCVDSCPGKALHFGDFGNPNSEVSKLAKTFNAKPLFPELRTTPSVLYIMPRGQETQDVGSIA